jgi:hypothetical protein
MSSFNWFRIDGDERGNAEFYFQLKDDTGHVMCTLCIAEDGLYYYRPGAHIFASESVNYKFLSMEEIHNLFEAFGQCEWFGDGLDLNLDISIVEDKIMIHKAKEAND